MCYGSESVPQLAPNQDDVEGSPPLECKGWFIELGKSRYERANERFTCNNISENGNTFNLTVYPVERSNIGQYGVLFENNQGHWYFRFEIKDEEILWYVVIVTCSLLGLCFAITTTMIAVFCKRRARKRRQRRESESQQNGEGEAPLTMPPPPAYSQAVDNEGGKSHTLPRHVEDEEEDDEDFELPPNSKLFKERKGRRRQQRSPRERATSTRSTPGDAAPPPCGVTNLTKRVYENLIGEPYGCTQEVKVPLMPPKTKTFSYTSQLPLMSPGHVAATSPPDEERSTRLSHESTTVRIYKS
nr:hypothetical protein BaRGS_015100 [Batillaria attramentaria]